MSGGSRTSDYDFSLPPELIAQTPAEPRDASRLMVVHRATGTIEHRVFRDLEMMIPGGDVLVLNRSRVRRARLLGTRVGSGAPAEVLLLAPIGGDRFEAMVSPGGKLKPGRVVEIGPDLSVEILETTPRRTRIVRLITTGAIEAAIEAHGHVPLPPYIDRPDSMADAARYQTVYARETGSAAAPTAGLHFTPALLAGLERRGVRRAEVVLHVGPGTFRPVDTDDPGEHVMHSEHYTLESAAVDTIDAAKRDGHATWAVGTTTVRTLETAAAGRHIEPGERDTAIFIRPPFTFRAVDRIITNFHLPRSTLVMLVAAFAGYDLTMHAYETAIKERYRFYSYGDAMAIL